MTPIVIDANVALATVVPLAYSQHAVALFNEWNVQGGQLAVPALWGYEVNSALRKSVAAEVLTFEQADLAIRDLWTLGVEEISGTIERNRRALTWSARLGQHVAYDAQYLVVAEKLGTSLWTADRRLQDRAHAAGADWVRWIGEPA